ncbi:MAG TPA: sigma-70 family RNA polymerase sigma factor [Gemmataceae bacterium]|jgi:RNA polymerase sigma-70 factor (ECF subfamily)|nr:sigma-70 family RNA polymerase sigma factor [Gemmataceae bacterium]
MTTHDSFANLIVRLRQGDQDAATMVFERYSARLLRLAFKNLDAAICSKVDPDDLIQSAFRSFFHRTVSGEFLVPSSWQELGNLLEAITFRKCVNKNKYFHRASRDVRREIALGTRLDSSSPEFEPVAEGPTAEEVNVLEETIHQLLNCFIEPHKQIVALLLKGWTPVQISERLHCTERTVYRVLHRAQAHLQDMDKW